VVLTLVMELLLLSGVPPLFAPATRALGAPPAMMFPSHHLDSLNV
jgi:hypothetical protein